MQLNIKCPACCRSFTIVDRKAEREINRLQEEILLLKREIKKLQEQKVPDFERIFRNGKI